MPMTTPVPMTTTGPATPLLPVDRFERDETAGNKSPRDGGPRPHVLCVDDDPQITAAVATVLANYELDITRSCCGRQALAIARDKRPDLILTDYSMPEGDGRLLVSELAQDRVTADIPVVVLTGRRETQLPARMRWLGAAGFLHKPVARERLLEEVARFVTLEEIDW